MNLLIIPLIDSHVNGVKFVWCTWNPCGAYEMSIGWIWCHPVRVPTIIHTSIKQASKQRSIHPSIHPSIKHPLINQLITQTITDSHLLSPLRKSIGDTFLSKLKELCFPPSFSLAWNSHPNGGGLTDQIFFITFIFLIVIDFGIYFCIFVIIF